MCHWQKFETFQARAKFVKQEEEQQENSIFEKIVNQEEEQQQENTRCRSASSLNLRLKTELSSSSMIKALKGTTIWEEKRAVLDFLSLTYHHLLLYHHCK